MYIYICIYVYIYVYIIFVSKTISRTEMMTTHSKANLMECAIGYVKN